MIRELFLLSIFFIGIIEETLNQIYYKAGQKRYKYLLAIGIVCRGYIWYYILRSVFTNLEESFVLASIYIFGNVLGGWLSMFLETPIDKFVIKIRHKGRRKKRWYLFYEKKI
jgi:RsiW-degrading membrane proteinase PrsW (M82 family)